MSDSLPPMTALTPLGETQARIETHGPITVREETNTALASYTARLGQEKPAKASLESYLEAPVPGPGRVASGTGIFVLWTGPDQWMVAAPHDTQEDLAQHLSGVAKGCASVTEQNDAWCRFDLTGAGLPDVFERLCPINVRAWTGGEATRTSIDHLGCFVVMHAAEHITVLGPRSSAGSLHHALMTAVVSAH